MKKLFLFLLVACFSVTLFAQTIVSTTPSNRNIILEEFTGKDCQYCPDGHKKAQQLMTQYPERFFAINVHQGGYAHGTPNYKTPYGDALASQAGIPGYPAGTVSRQKWTGVAIMGGSSNFAYDRGAWATCAGKGLVEPSCLNVAAAGTLDIDTRHLSLLVEVYYTGNAEQLTNKLTVAMLQNEIIGPQIGAATWYPEMMVGTQYRHMHMLRDYVTGTQWGMDITPTTTGSFWSHTFEYDVPQNFNNIAVVLEELEFVVFVAEGQAKIITGAHANIAYTGLPAIAGRIDAIVEKPVDYCSSDASAFITIKNVGQNTMTSAEINYTVAGGTSNTFVWNKREIASMTTDTIHIPSFQIQANIDQTLNVELRKINNESITPSVKSLTLKKEVVAGEASMKLVIATDQYASETTYKIFKPDGSILASGGPWGNLGGPGITVREIPFITTVDGCYKVEVYDSYGDGINAGYGAGYVKIFNGADTEIYSNNGKFGSKLTVRVTVNMEYYSISALAGENGTISPIGEKYYLEGSTVTYRFTPNNGYIVEDVFIDEEPMGMEKATSYTFPAVDKNYTISVTFKINPNSYTITATAGENGTIRPDGDTEYPENSTAEYIFTPDEGYEVEEVFIDDEPMGMEKATSYTFPAVDKDYKIHVTFKLAPIITTYTITATAGENGTIDPNGDTEYPEGSTAEYTFTPDEGYEVDSLLVDGVLMDSEAPITEYIFTDINADHTISVTFKLIDSIKDVNGVVISVAPNPVNDQLFVNGTYDKLEIFSISGQNLTSAFNKPSIDFNSYTKGIYFVKIYANGQICTFKIVK
jgi:hypothetical protein